MIRCQLGRVLQKRQLTLEEIARSTGLDHERIERLIADKPEKIDVEIVDRLCRRLNCDVGELFQWLDRTD